MTSSVLIKWALKSQSRGVTEWRPWCVSPAGAAVAGIYRVAGKNMAPLEALVWGVGQTVLTLIISFSRILATLWGFCGNGLLHRRKRMYRISENGIVNTWDWGCAGTWKEQVRTWGLAPCGETALWCRELALPPCTLRASSGQARRTVGSCGNSTLLAADQVNVGVESSFSTVLY